MPASVFVVSVGEVGGLAGTGFDEDGVTLLDEPRDGERVQPDAVLVSVDLAGNSDDHDLVSWNVAGVANGESGRGMRLGVP
jgi:hypothetical protein